MNKLLKYLRTHIFLRKKIRLNSQLEELEKSRFDFLKINNWIIAYLVGI